MNNFFTLLKYSLIDSFKLNKLKKKNNKFKLEYLVALIYLLVFGFVTLYMFVFTELFNEANAPDFIFLFAIVISALITFISTLTKANVYIFKTKDYELLMALPIKSSVIVACKIVSLYILNFVFTFTICAAVDISYFIVCGFDLRILLLSLLIIILLPLFPTVLSSFVAFLLGFIPLKQKTKNILSTILYVVMTVILMSSYFMMLDVTDEQFIASIGEMYQKIGKLYFLGFWAYEAIFTKDIIKLLLYILISIGSFIIYIILVGKFFKKFNGLLDNHKTKSNYNILDEKYDNSKGEIITLFQKELRMYIGFPAYILNTIVGPILSIVTAVMFALQYDNIKVTIEYLFESLNIQINENIFVLLMAFVNVLFVSLVTTTASSISLEGKSIWILKTSPLKTSSIFWAKILLNLLINIPVIIINMIICGIVVKANIFITIGAMIIPIAYSFVGAFLGLYFNLLKPNFNYDNPIKPIKQDLPVLFSMLLSFVITLFGFGTMFGLIMILDLNFVLIIEIVIALFMMIISLIILFKKGTKKYESLNL